MSQHTAQLLKIIAAMLAAYVWTRVPGLKPFSLQIVAGLFIAYFFIKHFGERGLNMNTLMPQALTSEFAIVTTALLMLVWYTGGISSSFLGLLYFLMFLGLFVLDFGSLTLLVVLIPFFLWSTTQHALNQHEWIALLTFPMLLPLILFAKTQYQEAKQEKKEVANLENSQYTSTLFLTAFLKPKLEHLSQLSRFPDENIDNIQKQVESLLEEISEHVDEPMNEQQEQ